MPKILKEIPDSKLLLVGQGKYQKNLEKLVSKLNLQNSVIFIGRVAYQDLPKYFLLGDLFATVLSFGGMAKFTGIWDLDWLYRRFVCCGLFGGLEIL